MNWTCFLFQCNKKAKRSDIVILYARTLKALDTSEQERMKRYSLHVKICPHWLWGTESCSWASTSSFHFPYSLKQFLHSLGGYCEYGLTNQGLACGLPGRRIFLLETQFLSLSLQHWNSKSCLGLYTEISSRENMQSCCQKAVYC